MIESDHDMRNPADMLVLERIAKSVLHTRGISLVQSITRPLGTPISHSSIPFQISAQSASQVMNLGYQQDRAADLLKQANDISNTIGILKQQVSLQQASAAATHEQTQAFHDTVAIVDDLRDKIANFDDQFRPIRNYLYWEPHCFDIPICLSLRSLFDGLDGIATLSDDIQDIVPDLDHMAGLTLQMTTVMPAQIQSMKNQKQMMLNQYQVQKAQQDQTMAQQDTSTAMGEAFDKALNDDSFYLAPEAFEVDDFKTGMKLMMSPDGHAVRFTIIHEGDR